MADCSEEQKENKLRKESKQEKGPVGPPLDPPLSVPSVHSMMVSASMVKNTSLRACARLHS